MQVMDERSRSPNYGSVDISQRSVVSSLVLELEKLQGARRFFFWWCLLRMRLYGEDQSRVAMGLELFFSRHGWTRRSRWMV